MGAIKATQDNSVAISNVYEQEQGDGDWVDNTPSVEYKLPEIVVESATSTSITSTSHGLTGSFGIRVYNSTDGLVYGNADVTDTDTIDITALSLTEAPTKAYFDTPVSIATVTEANASRCIAVGNINVLIDSSTANDGTNIVSSTKELIAGGRIVVDGESALGGTVTSEGNHGNLIPLMTSNNSPSGEAKAASVYNSTYEAYNAMDREQTDTYWLSNTSNESYLQYKSDVAIIVSEYTIAQPASGLSTTGNFPRDWELLGSNTGLFAGEEIILDTQVGQTFDYGDIKTYKIPLAKYFTYHRLRLTLNNGGSYFIIGNFELLEALKYTQLLPNHTELAAAAVKPTQAYLQGGEVLTKVSSTLTNFTGTNTISGLIEAGDSIQIDRSTDVVTSNVIETDNGDGTFQYDCTIPEQSTAPESAKVLDRSTTTTEASDVYDDATGKFTKTYNKIEKQGRAFKYKIEADENVEVSKVTIPMNKEG